MTEQDPILKGMAIELRNELLRRHLDPKKPPTGSLPPSVRAFDEYRKRGGSAFDDSDAFTTALIEEVGNYE